MAIGDIDFGTGVSRPMDATKRQFAAVVWQKGKPPLDAELNLMSQMEWENVRQTVRNLMPSGFLTDPTRSFADYQFNPLWANRFRLGNPREPTGFLESAEKDAVVWANVNGWVIPVVGTNVEAEGELFNVIDLKAPPETDSRVDFVFLEVWQTRIDPNPSTARKPSASTLWKYGNVLYGGTNVVDDIEDPTIGYETTGRIQTQYRLRTHGGGGGLGSSVALQVYPDGLGDPYIYGQGTSGTPQSTLGAFVNMREELGDPSLWRAGDGNPDNDFGTIDGYVYAIPVCAIFRRGSNAYVAVTASGNATQNGAFCRTPSAKLSAITAKNLTQMTLRDFLPYDAGVLADYTVLVSNLSDSGLDDPNLILPNVFLVIDDEIIGVKSINTVGGTITIPAGGRGRFGTAAVGHTFRTEIGFYNTRTDGLFADEVAATDILDLRHTVNAQDWDYNRLLAYNVGELVKGTLRSAWKQSATGDTQGPVVHEVDYMYASRNGALDPHSVGTVDGPDGIRTVFSDAATIQPDVTMLLDNTATNPANGYVDDTFETNVAWDVSPGFHTSGFMNGGTSFTDGTSIFLYTGGTTGNEGARATFQNSGTRGVRLVTPREYWKSGYPAFNPGNGNQNPVTVRFLGERALEPAPATLDNTLANPAFPNFTARHVGPMYPTRESNFERPYIVLGGLLNASLNFTAIDVNTKLINGGGTFYEIDVGVNFNTPGAWFSKDSNGEFQDDPALVANPLFHGLKTLYGMLTDGGRDSTGASSEIYVVVYGDKDSKANNGAFKVFGAGTLGMGIPATAATRIVVLPLSPEFFPTGFETTGNTVRVEFRSQYTHVEDTSAYLGSVLNGVADVVVVLTDIGGQTETPWKAAYLGGGAGDGYDLSLPLGGDNYPDAANKLALTTTLLYHPGHGGTARVADKIVHFARAAAGGIDSQGYLRQNPANVDTSFPGSSGAPDQEISWPINHIQLWNRLPSLGWNAPTAPNYGGNVVGFTEQDREHELFVDQGSKTIFFRPFRSREMTMKAETFTGVLSDCLLGSYAYNTAPPIAKDDLRLFTGDKGSGKLMGLPVPPEFMPRFGRQDIPYHQYDGENPMVIMPGINHLFRDSADITNPVFNVIGGWPTTPGTAAVNLMLFLTGNTVSGTAVYGQAGTTVAATNNQPFLGARNTTKISNATPYGQEVIDKLLAVNSSDFGRGLRGIQLPPYYGVSRLIGVYDARDFFAKGGKTILTTDRYSKNGADPAPNLLRNDVDRQTLFIMQDGAKDYTGETGDHTYVVPENVLDLTRCLNWNFNTPTDFADFNFVVVCSTFGFAKDWINGNNFVLIRQYNGQGNENVDGDNQEFSVPMVIPCPAGAMDQFYVAYDRTAYQGDVYMTRDTPATTASDYQNRYGQLTTAQQYAMRLPIQQYDSTGNYVPQIPNARAFEVLASMDFYTTMGTGKIGGQLYPGTPLDVCYTENTAAAALRAPLSNTAPMWEVNTRAFSEGQKSSDNRAKMDIAFLITTLLDTAAGPGVTTKKGQIKFLLGDGTEQKLYFAKPTNYAATVAAYGYDNVIEISDTTTPIQYTGSYTYPAATTLAPGAVVTQTVPVVGAAVGDSVVLEYSFTNPNIIIRGTVTAPDTVSLMAYNTITPAAFQMLMDNTGSHVAMTDQAVVATNIPAHDSFQHGPYTLTGLALGNAMAVGYTILGHDTQGLLFTAGVTAVDQYSITIHNTTAALIAWAGDNLRVVAFEALDVTAFTATLTGRTVAIRVLQTPSGWARAGDGLTQTVFNALSKIVGHPILSKSVTGRLDFGTVLHLEAVPTGAEGNNIRVTLTHTDPAMATNIPAIMRLEAPYSNDRANNAGTRSYTSGNFVGGQDFPMNAGPGVSQVKLTGMIERLPTGALLQDSDFLCENPLNDMASAMKSSPVGPRAIQSILPFTNGGEEYTRFFGTPGEIIGQSDGSVTVTDFGAWRRNNLSGSRIFRLNRGGGPLFVLSGDTPGGPVDWVSESFPAAVMPVLKGGVLVCRAMLVRNFYEEVQPGHSTVTMSQGDEIQMVIATYGILGNDQIQQDGLTLSGSISPAGYGEGYAASDRYRLAGRPMFKGTTRQVPDPAVVTLAVYPDGIR